MVDLEKTKYYQFANSDKNSLIETEDISDVCMVYWKKDTRCIKMEETL